MDNENNMAFGSFESIPTQPLTVVAEDMPKPEKKKRVYPKKMTDQEIFDTVYLGLKAQGFNRSKDSDSNACMFRGPNGLKCAVGLLLSDEDVKRNGNYGYSTLGLTWETRRKLGLDARRLRNSMKVNDYLIELQIAHDKSYTPGEMKDNLKLVANKRGLTVPE